MLSQGLGYFLHFWAKLVHTRLKNNGRANFLARRLSGRPRPLSGEAHGARTTAREVLRRQGPRASPPRGYAPHRSGGGGGGIGPGAASGSRPAVQKLAFPATSAQGAPTAVRPRQRSGSCQLPGPRTGPRASLGLRGARSPTPASSSPGFQRRRPRPPPRARSPPRPPPPPPPSRSRSSQWGSGPRAQIQTAALEGG